LEELRVLKENIRSVMIGNESTIDLMLTALLAGGHVLLEDTPGTGKTMMAKTLATSISGVFSRIQFTPDLLPGDVTGVNYFNAKIGEFVFSPGPAFCNILLADEINRATPRTQSALLECMEERQITVDGETNVLSKPFFVIATQNPLESLGTFPLPEAQLDRFLLQISMEELTPQLEMEMVNRFMVSTPIEELASVCSPMDIVMLQEECRRIFIHEELVKYIIALSQATRHNGYITNGISPRGTLALIHAVQAYAMVNGRSYVVPEDIKFMLPYVAIHRIKLANAFAGPTENRRNALKVLEEIMAQVQVPTEEWSR